MDNSPPSPNQNPSQSTQKTASESLSVNIPASTELSQPQVETKGAQPGPAPQETAPSGGEQAKQNAGMSLPPVVTPPVADDTAQAADDGSQGVTATVSGANPATADDVDVVEKEWVDRARKIVDQTKDDPYRQEQEVEKLQIDYLKKRYGKDIKPGDPAT